MATNACTTENRTGIRPTYIALGHNDDGAVHTYRTTDETVHVVQDGKRTHVQELGTKSVDAWIDYVDARRRLDRRDYGLSVAEMLERQVEVAG